MSASDKPEQPEHSLPRVLVVDDHRNHAIRMAKELGIRLVEHPRYDLVDSMLHMEELEHYNHARLHAGLDVLHIPRDEPHTPRSFFPSDADLERMVQEISKSMRAEMPILLGGPWLSQRIRIKPKIPRKLKKKLKKQGLY